MLVAGEKSGRVNIIPIGDKIMPGNHRYSNQNNAVPGDNQNTIDSYKKTREELWAYYSGGY